MAFGRVGRGFRNALATLFQAGNTVVINANGEFLYSGIPAFGNLIISDTPAAGTDPFGNAYLAGMTAYVSHPGVVIAHQVLNGFNWWTAATAAGPYTNVEGLMLSDVSLAGNFVTTLVSAGFLGNITAIHPSSSPAAAESWQSGAALLQSPWTSVAAAPFQYQLEGVNGSRVRVRGQITNSVAYVAFNNVTGAAPAGYSGTATAWGTVFDTTGNAPLGFKVQNGALAFLQFTTAVPINHVIALDHIGVLPLD